jgi:hypothetical protein
MNLRIRFSRPKKIARRSGNRQFALLAGALLTLATLAAWLLALWRIAAEMEWAGGFAISSGVFSHWQVWLAAALLLQVCSRILNRYGNGGGAAASR